jgi:hypothetical protein
MHYSQAGQKHDHWLLYLTYQTTKTGLDYLQWNDDDSNFLHSLINSQRMNTFLALFENRRINTVFTTVRH